MGPNLEGQTQTQGAVLSPALSWPDSKRDLSLVLLSCPPWAKQMGCHMFLSFPWASASLCYSPQPLQEGKGTTWPLGASECCWLLRRLGSSSEIVFLSVSALEKWFQIKQEFSREDAILGTRVYILRNKCWNL